jgi:hypothetical protein
LKPSDQVKQLAQLVAQQRLRKAKTEANNINRITVIMSPAEERRVLESLGKEPMTWIMAILSFLDQAHDAVAAQQEPPQT